MNDRPSYTFADRELSWVSFNERVLHEAADSRVPLLERLSFLAIFSSNLDEFFRVRVAALRSLLRLKKKKVKKLELRPKRLLREIHARVTAQQERFGEIFRESILPELEAHDVHLVDDRSVSPEHQSFLIAAFDNDVRPLIEWAELDQAAPPFLEDRRVYLVVEARATMERGSPDQPSYGLIQVPEQLPRFLSLPETRGRREVMFLDDVIRFALPHLLPDLRVGGVYAIKLSRDAELHLEDEFSGDIVEAIRKGLGKRRTGAPSRFLYDLRTPQALLQLLQNLLGLDEDDLVGGGRYHNLHDLHTFPRTGLERLVYDAAPPMPHPALSSAPSVIDAIRAADRLAHFPYQDFGPVLRMLQEAASDPDVTEIWATLYRVSGDSAIVRALIAAAEAGKRVRVFVEVKARFDEASNLEWGARMEAAGVETLYSFSDLKVHAKLALIRREEPGEHRLYAYLGTGNLNEKTARVYADHGLFTADPRLTREVRRVFAFLVGEQREPRFEHLLVAPFQMRERFYGLIQREVGHARAGRPSGMTLKMNSLEDTAIIERLYEASREGVPIRLIVRGICRLIPGVSGQSETISATSIVDRYLEHARLYHFRNGGDDEYFLASADWMHRNLSRRVEVAFPVYDERLRRELRAIVELQLADNVKARIIDGPMSNAAAGDAGASPVRAQTAIREVLVAARLDDPRAGLAQAKTEERA